MQRAVFAPHVLKHGAELGNLCARMHDLRRQQELVNGRHRFQRFARASAAAGASIRYKGNCEKDAAEHRLGEQRKKVSFRQLLKQLKAKNVTI
jgi:hypothetical protein